MGQWNSSLNSTLNFEDLEMEIDGRGELRLLRPNRT